MAVKTVFESMAKCPMISSDKFLLRAARRGRGDHQNFFQAPPAHSLCVSTSEDKRRLTSFGLSGEQCRYHGGCPRGETLGQATNVTSGKSLSSRTTSPGEHGRPLTRRHEAV
jgi:hypothetical protein